MLSVIEHLKTAFPETSILLVSVGDREYKNENGDLRTMPGVKNLIRYQQSIAADSHIAFWNMYEAMGGQGSIVDMIGQKWRILIIPISILREASIWQVSYLKH